MSIIDGPWMSGIAAREAKRDGLSAFQRLWELVAVAVIALIVYYFVRSQTLATGFFTPSFGPGEAVVFYATGLYGTVPPLLRAFVGKRNAVRPAEVFRSGLSAAVGTYFLYSFPFDVSRLADALPANMHVRPVMDYRGHGETVLCLRHRGHSVSGCMDGAPVHGHEKDPPFPGLRGGEPNCQFLGRGSVPKTWGYL